MEKTVKEEQNLAIKLRKFRKFCLISGYRPESIKEGAWVVVVTERGMEIGEIVRFLHACPKSHRHSIKLKKIVRYATKEDLDKMATLPADEQTALKVVQQKVKEHELPIKIVQLEYLFDRSTLIIYYCVESAKKGFNVKELGKDLALTLKTHVDLQQIQPRDKATLLGGIGPCGRELCCCVWLDKPRSVSVKMVKEQGIAFSPSKTAGVCGKLMCCLAYENGKL